MKNWPDNLIIFLWGDYMKRMFPILICLGMLVSGCAKNENTASDSTLRIGDELTVTGVVDYSDEPSDIGIEYCFISSDTDIEYYYTDVYDEESKWHSNVFYTIGSDTELLKEYVGQKLTVSGIFDAESHGIPYITNIEIVEK